MTSVGSLNFAESKPFGGGGSAAGRWNSVVVRAVTGVSRAEMRQNRINRIQSLGFENIGREVGANADKLIEAEFRSSSPNIDKICRLIPRVKDKRILTALYLEIFRLSFSASHADKARLAGLCLAHGEMKESVRNRIFLSKNIMNFMDQRDLVNLYLSSKNPVESIDFIRVVGLTKISELLLFCMKHGFEDSIAVLSFRLSDEDFSEFIEELLIHKGGSEFASISLIPQELLSDVKEQFFSFFDSLSKSDFDDMTIRSTVLGFLATDDVLDYLLNDASSPNPDHLKSVFTVLLKNLDSLSSKLHNILPTIAHRIFPSDTQFVSDLVVHHLLGEQSLVTYRLIPLIDYLSIDALNLIDAKLTRMMKMGDFNESVAKGFIKAAKKKHIMVWKRTAGYEHLQDLRLISKGTQVGKDGLVDYEKAQKVVKALNAASPNSVFFHEGALEEDLEGGVCSAMSFRVLRLFIDQPANSTPEEKIKNLGPALVQVDPEYRTIQAAYNTISRSDESVPFSPEFNRFKIESLLKYECPTRTILQQSPSFDLDQSKTSTHLAAYLKDLPNGKFIVRSLNPLDPMESDVDHDPFDSSKSKGENYGHTTLLIKENNSTFYYDPTVGFMEFTNPEQLPMILQWEHARWNLPQTTLYQVSN